MSKLILALIAITVIFSFNTFSKNSLKKESQQNGCILEDIATAGLGDIKYSILNEADFQAVNGGPGVWVLLRGQSKTDLNIPNGEASVFDYLRAADHVSTTNLPDARGIFLRGKNHNREGGLGNPEGELLLGQRQADENKEHSHVGNMELGAEPAGGGSRSARAAGSLGGSTHQWDSSYLVKPSGGPEARPRNITVNTFIKVKPACIDASTTGELTAAKARLQALEQYVLKNSCDECLSLPEGNLTELRAKNVCFKTQVDAYEAQTKEWTLSCLARTVGSSKKVLMQIGASNRTAVENTYLTHLDNEYPYYNAIEEK